MSIEARTRVVKIEISSVTARLYIRQNGSRFALYILNIIYNKKNGVIPANSDDEDLIWYEIILVRSIELSEHTWCDFPYQTECTLIIGFYPAVSLTHNIPSAIIRCDIVAVVRLRRE